MASTGGQANEELANCVDRSLCCFESMTSYFKGFLRSGYLLPESGKMGRLICIGSSQKEKVGKLLRAVDSVLDADGRRNM